MRWGLAGARTRSQQAAISDCPLSSTISPLVPPGHASALLSGALHPVAATQPPVRQLRGVRKCHLHETWPGGHD